MKHIPKKTQSVDAFAIFDCDGEDLEGFAFTRDRARQVTDNFGGKARPVKLTYEMVKEAPKPLPSGFVIIKDLEEVVQAHDFVVYLQDDDDYENFCDEARAHHATTHVHFAEEDEIGKTVGDLANDSAFNVVVMRRVAPKRAKKPRKQRPRRRAKK